MSLYEARLRAAQAERRRNVRFTIDIPVCFRTIAGDRPCHMANISDSGAKLETSAPPREGVTGWLVLGNEEIFCKVIWTSETACGVEFERTLGQDRLIGIAGEKVSQGGPIANAGNIQMGRRRGGRLVASGG